MRPDLILKTLEDAGFAACFVGGCVRDTLLGRPVHDWDVTTSALPEEIMALFSELNREGITVVLVTHEADIAAHARRQVRFLDGLIVSDHATPALEAATC